MIITVNEIVVLWVAFILGALLAVLVVAYVFSSKLRDDLRKSTNHDLVATGSSATSASGSGEKTSSFSVAARGVIVALVSAFLLALISLVALPALSSSKLATADQAKEVVAEVEKTQRDLAESNKANESLAQETARLKSLKLEAFYIGEYARAPFGRQFPCGTDTTIASKEVCGVGSPVTLKAISSHGGNRCGYTYFAVACAPR